MGPLTRAPQWKTYRRGTGGSARQKACCSSAPDRLAQEEFPNQAKRRLVGPVPPLKAGSPIGHQADWARTPATGAFGWGGPAALPPVALSPQSLAAGLKPRRQAGDLDQESGGANVR